MICVDWAPRQHVVGPQVRRPRRRSRVAGSSAVAEAGRRTRRHGSALVCVAVGPRPSFPGGPAVSRSFCSLDNGLCP